MQNGQFSSFLGETMKVRICLHAVLHHARSRIKGVLLNFKQDNQGSIYYLSHLMDFGRVLEDVKLIYEIAASHDVHLGIWCLKSLPDIQVADHADQLSRTVEY